MVKDLPSDPIGCSDTGSNLGIPNFTKVNTEVLLFKNLWGNAIGFTKEPKMEASGSLVTEFHCPDVEECL